jgi:3-oxoacyl-[acyl-carrier protein] reductase
MGLAAWGLRLGDLGEYMSRVVLITGGTRGIGRALAVTLLKAGDKVAVTGTTEDGVVKAERELAQLGQVAAIVCNVREVSSAELAVRTAVAKFGRLDVLVNNAGVGVGVPIAEMPHDEWDRIIGTNITGVFNCCKAAIPHLRQRGGGWIVNISSLASKNPFAGGAAYCASKAAVNAFSEALMQELRDDNIRVTYVLPGSVATGFSGREATSGSDWKLLPEDVAQAIVDVLDHPARSLPSRIEIRPSRPMKS